MLFDSFVRGKLSISSALGNVYASAKKKWIRKISTSTTRHLTKILEKKDKLKNAPPVNSIQAEHFLNQNTVIIVKLVLNDLSGPADKGFYANLKVLILILHINRLKSPGFSGAGQGETPRLFPTFARLNFTPDKFPEHAMCFMFRSLTG